MARASTGRQWGTNAQSEVQPHLHSDEVLLRIVQAASVGRVWWLALIELFYVSTGIRGIFHFPSKAVAIGMIVVIFFAGCAALRLTRFRNIVVTDQRILVFDAGFWARHPTKRLLREFAPIRATEIPSKRWRRFVSMGEALYFLGSWEFVRAGLVTSDRIAGSKLLSAGEGRQGINDSSVLE
ncbi:MAG: hypothetical protein ACYC1I_11805 [Acidimicrobiales bacterium]